jgi:uncharacterized membrane protein (UPF0127 family)
LFRRALVVALLVVAGCADDGSPDDATRGTVTLAPSSSGPTTPDADASPDPGPTGVRPEGFSTVTARITEVDGDVCEVCVWLADIADERARGLMGVTDLGDAVGMVFRFDEPVGNSFYMLNTPTPLSIAWFAPGGEYLAQTDMEPCLEVPEGGCPLYRPDGSYDLALEVFQGDLEDLGVGPGARLEIVAGTEADRCPALG